MRFCLSLCFFVLAIPCTWAETYEIPTVFALQGDVKTALRSEVSGDIFKIGGDTYKLKYCKLKNDAKEITWRAKDLKDIWNSTSTEFRTRYGQFHTASIESESKSALVRKIAVDHIASVANTSVNEAEFMAISDLKYTQMKGAAQIVRMSLPLVVTIEADRKVGLVLDDDGTIALAKTTSGAVYVHKNSLAMVINWSNDVAVFYHELGHYFGLPHTWGADSNYYRVGENRPFPRRARDVKNPLVHRPDCGRSTWVRTLDKSIKDDDYLIGGRVSGPHIADTFPTNNIDIDTSAYIKSDCFLKYEDLLAAGGNGKHNSGMPYHNNYMGYGWYRLQSFSPNQKEVMAENIKEALILYRKALGAKKICL